MTVCAASRPIRILHITDQLSKGGAGRALIGVAKYSARLGSFQHECISVKPLFDGVVSEGVTEGLQVQVAPDLEQIRALITSADIVQWHWWQDFPLMRADLPRKPTVVWCAVSGEYPPNELPKSVVDFADVMVVTNPLTYDLPAIRSLDESERHRKVCLIFESADFERIFPVEKIAHDTFNVGWIGTIAPGKYHPRYVEMSSGINIPNVQFLVCGAGSLQDHAMQEASRLNVADRFQFLGYQNDLRRFLGTLDVYGFPLDEKTFAGGELNLQEAMVAGLPIVVLPYGGPKRMILHNYNGYIAYSDREYQECIEFLYHHPEERERLSSNAKDYALREFGAENAARKFNQLYSELFKSTSTTIQTSSSSADQVALTKQTSNKRLAYHHLSRANYQKAADYARVHLQSAPADAEILRILARLEELKAAPEQAELNHIANEDIEKIIDKRRFSSYKVTVLVSTYNSADVIAGCLHDLSEQTLYKRGDLEILVIDSASPQNEWQIIENFCAQHDHILAVRTKKRETLYAAWNRAIRLCRGEYISNANADDRHRRVTLEVLSAVLDENAEVAIAYGDVLKTNRPNETIERNTAKDTFCWGEFSLEKLEDHCCVGPQPLWRRSLHEELGYFDEQYRCAADYDFWLRVALKYPLRHVDQILGLYLDSPESLEHSGLSNHYERVDVLNRHYLRKQQPLKEKSLVTVIIPTFNRPILLKGALISLIDQSYDNWEALVINDGGEELTAGKGGLPADGRIRIVNLPQNHERSYCRNLGINEACGKYIAFLDDDDVFYRHHLELAVQALESDKDGRKIWYSNSCETKVQLDQDELRITNMRLAYNHDFNRNLLLIFNYIPILALVFHREVLATEHFDEKLNLLEDYDLLIRLSRTNDFMHAALVTNEFRTFKVRDSSVLARHRAQYKMLYNRYRDFSAGEGKLCEEQQRFLRSLENQVLACSKKPP